MMHPALAARLRIEWSRAALEGRAPRSADELAALLGDPDRLNSPPRVPLDAVLYRRPLGYPLELWSGLPPEKRRFVEELYFSLLEKRAFRSPGHLERVLGPARPGRAPSVADEFPLGEAFPDLTPTAEQVRALPFEEGRVFLDRFRAVQEGRLPRSRAVLDASNGSSDPYFLEGFRLYPEYRKPARFPAEEWSKMGEGLKRSTDDLVFRRFYGLEGRSPAEMKAHYGPPRPEWTFRSEWWRERPAGQNLPWREFFAKFGPKKEHSMPQRQSLPEPSLGGSTGFHSPRRAPDPFNGSAREVLDRVARDLAHPGRISPPRRGFPADEVLRSPLEEVVSWIPTLALAGGFILVGVALRHWWVNRRPRPGRWALVLGALPVGSGTLLLLDRLRGLLSALAGRLRRISRGQD